MGRLSRRLRRLATKTTTCCRCTLGAAPCNPALARAKLMVCAPLQVHVPQAVAYPGRPWRACSRPSPALATGPRCVAIYAAIKWRAYAAPAVPWLLNVPVAYAELAARGPHAVVGQAGSIMGRAACTKCRGMNPLLGACTASLQAGAVLTRMPRCAGLQDRFTPEVDPCVAYYDTDHARRKCVAFAARSRGSC